MNEAKQAETVLYAAYQEQAGWYRLALKQAEEMYASLLSGENAEDGRLPQIMAHLDETAAIEARVEAVKQWWLQTGQKPGPQLREVLDQVTQLIERLATCIHESEVIALDKKQRLMPELDQATRGLQMQRAYSSTRSMPTRQHGF